MRFCHAARGPVTRAHGGNVSPHSFHTSVIYTEVVFPASLVRVQLLICVGEEWAPVKVSLIPPVVKDTVGRLVALGYRYHELLFGVYVFVGDDEAPLVCCRP